MFTKLTLKYNYVKSDMWGKYLLYLLSTNPEITTVRDMFLQQIPVFKGKNLIPFKLNDINFFIDDWDYSYPTSYLGDHNIPSCYSNNYPPLTILKVQYDLIHKEKYDILYNKYKIKVLPFIMFPNRYFNLAFDKWKYNNDQYLCFHTGRIWRGRSAWVSFLNTSNLNIPKIHKELIIDKEYEQLLLKTKWGLILKGKGVGKNRREVEYMSIGMPLALNYKPHYPFEYNANEHYVFLEKPQDILKLQDIDPEPYAQKSLEIYEKYYSIHHGLYNSFNMAYTSARII